MATRTQSRTSNRSNSNSAPNRSSSSGGSSNQGRSAFSWGEGAGPVIAAALGGMAIGLAANYGRKALMQGMEAAVGDWDQILATEHDRALAIFDKMLATDQGQTFKRKMLLMKLTHALDKHAHQEEMVVYPALREANEASDADHLEGEHGYIKTFIYELNEMGADAPTGSRRCANSAISFRGTRIWRRSRSSRRSSGAMSEEQNAHVTSLVNRDGFWMA